MDDDLLFDDLFAEDEEESHDTNIGEQWKVLIVDDEKDIHTVIRMALDGFEFQSKKIKFYDAYSGKEAREILHKTPDIALILLDVVMETLHAGLEFVQYVREKLENPFIRIVLWTGQAGQAPKREAVIAYEINDYKTKTELTTDNIFSVVLSSLRTYDAMITVESFRQNLEIKVKERTKELEAEKEKVTYQKKEITDSIRYAKRIQTAILPPHQLLNENFSDYLILDKPRDIVSGDFYWLTKKKNKIFIAAADCTGHGVPGAFMSMLGIAFLNEIVNKANMTKASEILNHLRDNVINSLNQSGRIEETKDGMDIALCIIDKESNMIEFAGANNPMYIYRNSVKTFSPSEQNEGNFEIVQDKEYQLRIQKPDRMPIGVHAFSEISFTNNVIPTEPGDTIYIFSDGYVDQFGGDHDKKFKSRPFKQLLFQIQEHDMAAQHEILLKNHEDWMGDKEQIDDILIIGVKI
ncbi:MAG: SpoIIE family protein phosphatase [Bacteroidetes bacterium]|jgi:serine phosphatase RsbU (regulator of sigma subunit)|nr:SpoIIE family protein phosphatase [Bacteroidota bacterium]MBT6686554.1 SpoIIE family protein phosphatase [Bacteroidota bacterium]MBT7142917.1 SpoIIE family protein phosphatase [Bacteroidota bacterium]MBT7490634.1 SpoIIE family protein phosphatase [Bacteroidota bacterium]